MIAIIDFGVGNISSIGNIIKKMGGEYFVCKKPQDLYLAKKIIVPGVGSFDYGMERLSSGGWIKPLNELALIQKKDVLGICLGMQLMCNESEEGVAKGLGWINANVVKFNFDGLADDLKVPHMGWNNIEILKETPLFSKNSEEERFYFVHSYYVKCLDLDNITATAKHGTKFTAAFQKDNIYGVQFHPEKSHKFGMKLIKKFIIK